ncbi:MAG TPA: MarR family transcriptional regulator [Candidatus Paceibacterota bacterium]|nr:MarR family transcriptional regulator [Candidatus Paceibacterota bacterium]
MANIDNKPNLGDLLLIFRRNILESMRKEGFKHDLTFSQVEILRFIGPVGKETMRSIAGYLKITPPSATEIVAEMEKGGLVRRMNDKKDRRVVFIALSNLAKRLFVSISRRKNMILKKMTDKLDSKDRKNLERIIKILINK